MHNQYVLTLAAIEARLYTNESDSIFMRWPTAEKELPCGNHTPDGLSETCLHFMEDIMTKSGRPNHKWDYFLFLHFGGWDLLLDYVRKDSKRRGYLLRCEEKGYSVSGDRMLFDSALVTTQPVKGVISAVPSTTMNCIVEANVYLVRNFCGLYSGAGMDALCGEIRRFLETGPDEEKTLDPQMDAHDRYCIFMYIQSCLDKYEAARDDSAEPDILSGHLGTALSWLLLAALLRDSCENLCRLIPLPTIQLLRVQIREASESPVPAIAPSSLPPVPMHFLGREEELEALGEHFRSSRAPFFLTGEGACGKTSLAAALAIAHKNEWTSLYAVYTDDLRNTIASIRFRDTLPMDQADVETLYRFNMSRLTQFGAQILLIVDNMDAPQYDRTFTELLAHPIGEGLTNADLLEELQRTGARLLFTTRTTPPPQYLSMCLSDPDHAFPLRVLLDLSREIYTDCPFSEYEEVLMSQIILAVGKHVLMVELLSAALQQQSGFTSMEEVLRKLQSLQLPSIEGSVVTRRNPSSAGSVYELARSVFSFASLGKESRQMLQFLSLLSPLGMDRDVFFEIASAGTGTSTASIRQTLLRLRDLHLVSIEPRTAHISMHPVIADVAAADLHPDLTACGRAIESAMRYYDPDSTKNYDVRQLSQVSAMSARSFLVLGGDPAVFEDTGDVPHTNECGDTHLQGDVSAVSACRMQLSLAVSQIEYHLGNYKLALSWSGCACREYGCCSTGQGEPALLAKAIKCAAQSLVKLGIYEETRRFYEEAVDLLTDAHGGEHKDTAEAWNDLGVALEEMGDPESAMECLMKAWEIQKKLFGTDSLEISSTCNNLGMVFADLGDSKSAESYYRQSLDISLRHYGENHPDTAVSYSNLGELLLHLGENDPEEPRLGEARPYLERALRIFTATFGPDYPSNACILSNLGILEDMEGNYRVARSNYERAFKIQSSIAGPEHPHCADILHNMSVSCIDEAFAAAVSDKESGTEVGDEAAADPALLLRALEYDRRALSIARKSLGDSHAMTKMLEDSVHWLQERLEIPPE